VVEVHPNPGAALSDGAQSLRFEQYEELVGKLRPVPKRSGARSDSISPPFSGGIPQRALWGFPLISGKQPSHAPLARSSGASASGRLAAPAPTGGTSLRAVSR
jgi:hypothetical protein